MNRQKKFVEMIETLTGKPISLEDKIGQSKAELEASCVKLTAKTGTNFKVNIEEGCEPCPFYCSSIDKPFDFVFIGLNPGKVLDSWEDLNFHWQKTTWQELTDFCIPTDIRATKNGYQLIKLGKKKKNGKRAKGPESPFWKFFLRLHIALTTNEIFNTWGELKKSHKDVEKFFIDHIAAHSFLNADLIPYKSYKTSFAAGKLVSDTSYGKYFQKLIDFIETESKLDAWIIFYGARDEVHKLLQKFMPDWNVPPKANLHFKPEPNRDPNHFYIFNREQRKILLSPFLTGEFSQPMSKHIDILVNAMKNFEKKLSLS